MHTTKAAPKHGTSYTAASQKHILPVIIFHVAGMLHLDAVEFSTSFTEWLSLIQRYSEPCSTLPSTFDQKSGVISAASAPHSFTTSQTPSCVETLILFGNLTFLILANLFSGMHRRY